jgi:hypothetical protein
MIYTDLCFLVQIIKGKTCTVNRMVKFLGFIQFSSRVSISLIHNNSDYSSLDPKNINTVGQLTPQNYTNKS